MPKLTQFCAKISTELRVEHHSMKPLQLTRKHILDALEIKQHLFRQWMECLEPYRSQESQMRVPREFSRADLIFFSIIKSLRVDFHFSLESIKPFSENLARCLASPIPATGSRSLFINLKTGEVSLYQQDFVETGLTVELESHITLCNTFLGLIETDSQTHLPFGLFEIHSRHGNRKA